MKNERSHKSKKIFFAKNAFVLLIAGYFACIACFGSLISGFAVLKSFSTDSIKMIAGTFGFLVIGFIVLWILSELLHIKSVSDQASHLIAKSHHSLVLGWRFYFVAFLTTMLKGWAIRRFPMNEPELVYYTMTDVQGGFDRSIIFEIIAVCLFSYFFGFVCKHIIQSSEEKHGIYFVDCVFAKRVNFNLLYLFFGIFVLCISIITTFRGLHAQEYVKLAKKNSMPAVDSPFYRNEYYPAEIQNIIFPDKKKNVIIIIMESMESSFADIENGGYFTKSLIPNLTSLAHEHLQFSNTDKLGGGTDLSGSGWTVAAILSKFSGLPFNLVGKQAKKRDSFLPGAITITDILGHNGYRQVFLFGSDKHFARRGTLLETHGGVEVHDFNWYKEAGLLPKGYRVFWGFEDQKLYSFAKRELEQLGNATDSSRPFMLGLLTVDTHMPKGYRCDLCPSSEDMQLKNVIRCADTQVSAFIDWCKTQPWFKDTLIVITGDHRFMDTKETSPFKSGTAPGAANSMSRRWFNVFINAQDADKAGYSITHNRKFASVDMFPTILAAMGCIVKDNRLGFGVNLFSGEKTLCERYSEEYINQELMRKNIQYEALEQPVKK